MTQLQEAIRDKITKYSDACGMCTDIIKECDKCSITCMLEDLNELQRLANRQDAVRPTAHLENEDNLFGAQNASQTITPTSDRIRQLVDKRNEAQDSIVSIRYNMIGRRYRHFKGSIYIVDGIAVHSETAEPLVIYHEEHELNRMWARPLSMFLSPVDKKKYPDATQEMRFEKIYGE